jgi:hypothetical protein
MKRKNVTGCMTPNFLSQGIPYDVEINGEKHNVILSTKEKLTWCDLPVNGDLITTRYRSTTA